MVLNYLNKSNGLLRLAMVMACAFFLAFLSVGCDDDGSFEAKLEEAKIAIDDGNYDKAVDILTDLAQTSEVQETLAGAYAGQAGVDTFDILAEVDDNDDDGDDGSIDLIGKILGTNSDNSLTCEMVLLKSSLIDQAKTTLIASAGGDYTALDEDGQAKLAIYGFTDFVIVIGEILCSNYGGGNAQFTVTLTEAGIKSLDDDFTGINVDIPDQTNRIDQDLAYVAQGITALGAGNDLAEEFSVFLLKIDPDRNGVDQTDLENFLNGLGD